jgi:hypothetical protein
MIAADVGDRFQQRRLSAASSAANAAAAASAAAGGGSGDDTKKNIINGDGGGAPILNLGTVGIGGSTTAQFEFQVRFICFCVFLRLFAVICYFANSSRDTLFIDTSINTESK